MPQGRAGAARSEGEWLERPYAGKIADWVAFLFPFLLLAGLALGGGGYDLLSRHLAGILSWALVAVLLIGRWPDRIRPGRSVALIGGILLSLALFSAISSFWSSSVSLSLAEAERVVGYLGFFLAGYLTMRTPKQREWFVRGIAAGLAAMIVLALGDRLISGGEAGDGVAIARLSFPLGYWNADGIVFATALVLFTWFAATSTRKAWQVGSLAVACLAATSLYLTYSRGGILAVTIAMILLFFLTPRRLRLTATFVITVAASVPILATVNLYPAISGDAGGDPTVTQSLIVVLATIGAITLGVLALQAVFGLARRSGERTRRALAVSKDRRTLLTVAGAGAALILISVLVFGGGAWDQFSDSDVPAPTDAQSRFTELSGSWRYEFNQVALDAFADHPVLGAGAGTYPIEWTRRRDIPVVTQDAHSFYLENLAELGVLGGLLALAFALSLLGLGARAWRRGIGRDAPLALALAAGLLVSLAFDWFWKLGATAALLMFLAAWIASAETVDPRRRDAAAGTGLKIGGLLASWLAIVVLAVPAVTDRYERASADSVRAGKIDQAIDQAKTASRLEPWAAYPHMQLGTIAESRDQFRLARAEYDRAIELEPDNWRAVLLRFGLNYRAGRITDARRDYQLLRQINPAYFGRLSFDGVRALVS